MEELLQKVKQNLILSHAADDELLKAYITAAVSYAESYQHLEKDYYQANPMPPTTEQAVIMLSPISMNPGTAALAAFLLIMSRPGSRSGTRSTFCSGWIGGGRYEFW